MTTPTTKPDDGGPVQCISMRAFIATAALQGLVTGTDMAVVDMKDGYHQKTMAIVIDAAVSYADALIERLKR